MKHTDTSVISFERSKTDD